MSTSKRKVMRGVSLAWQKSCLCLHDLRHTVVQLNSALLEISNKSDIFKSDIISLPAIITIRLPQCYFHSFVERIHYIGKFVYNIDKIITFLKGKLSENASNSYSSICTHRWAVLIHKLWNVALSQWGFIIACARLSHNIRKKRGIHLCFIGVPMHLPHAGTKYLPSKQFY